MYCAQCGGEIADGGKFCGQCGAPIAASGVPDMNKEASGSGRNSQGRRTGKKPVLLASLVAFICVVFAVAGILIWRKSRTVEFEDFLVERCVREELGKDWDDTITLGELASIKELTISWEKDITVSYDLNYMGLAYSGYVNLADLQYLTGLETLELDFCQKNDVFEHLEAITSCKNLKSLSMPLVMQDYNYTNGYVGKGYGYLSDLFAQLPELEEVDFRVTIPGELQSLLQPEDSDRKIVFAEGIDFSDYIVSARGIRLVSEPRGLESGPYRTIGPTSFKQGMEDAVICVDEGETFDCKDLTDYKDLKTLVIYCPAFSSLISGNSPQVVNLEALAELPCLCSLSLGNVKVDLAGVEEFPCLRELYLAGCDTKKVSSLQGLSSLRELSIVYSDAGASALSDLWGHLPKLRYFCGLLRFEGSGIDRALGNIKEARALETLVLLHDSDRINLEDALEGLELKNLWLAFVDMREVIDLDDLPQMDSLETLYCSRAESLDEFIDGHPNLVSVTVNSFSMDADELTDYCNDAIRAAAGNDRMSMLSMRSVWDMRIYDIMQNINVEQLYEAGIYDDAVQRGAFLRDMDVQEYYRERFRPGDQ